MIKPLASSLLALLIGAIPVNAQSSDFAEQQQLVDKAKLTVEAFSADPDFAEPVRELAPDVKAILIVPQFVRGALVLGGAGGSGVLLVRGENSGEWSQPAFYRIGSASFGLQIGADVSGVVILVRTMRGLEEFYRSDFKLGLNTGMTVGWKGGTVAVHGITADTVSYAQSKGAFGSIVSLAGAMVTVSDESNAAYYGQSVRPTEILLKGEVKNDQSLPLREAVAKLMK